MPIMVNHVFTPSIICLHYIFNTWYQTIIRTSLKFVHSCRLYYYTNNLAIAFILAEIFTPNGQRDSHA